MTKSNCFLILMALLAIAPKARSATPAPIVAVFEIENRGSGLSNEEIRSLTDYLANKLGEQGAFQIVPRDEIKKRLVEQKNDSYQSCFEQGCQIEIGRELAAQFTLTTNISKVGSQCLLTSALYDLKKATTSRSATARGPCKADDLISHIEVLANQIKGLPSTQLSPTPVAQPSTVQPTPISTPPNPPPVVVEQYQKRDKSVWAALAWSILPGGGLYYTNHNKWGTFYLLVISGGIATLIGSLGAPHGDFQRGLTITGAAVTVGGYGLSMIHAMIAAAVWEDPDAPKTASAQPAAFLPVRVGERPASAYSPAVIFPVFSGRF